MAPYALVYLLIPQILNILWCCPLACWTDVFIVVVGFYYCVSLHKIVLSFSQEQAVHIFMQCPLWTCIKTKSDTWRFCSCYAQIKHTYCFVCLIYITAAGWTFYPDSSLEIQQKTNWRSVQLLVMRTWVCAASHHVAGSSGLFSQTLWQLISISDQFMKRIYLPHFGLRLLPT